MYVVDNMKSLLLGGGYKKGSGSWGVKKSGRREQGGKYQGARGYQGSGNKKIIRERTPKNQGTGS